MRSKVIVLGLALGLLFPLPAAAVGSPRHSILRVAHPSILSGQRETLDITARDLTGHPLANASVAATVRYSGYARRYHLLRTDRLGHSSLTFRSPNVLSQERASVAVTVSNQYLSIPLNGAFTIGRRQASVSGGLLVSVQPLPTKVVASQPVYLVVSARTRSGRAVSGARVRLQVRFPSGTIEFKATTDVTGVTAVRVDTSGATPGMVVQVSAAARLASSSGHAGTKFDVEANSPSPIPTSIPLPAPTPTATPFPTPTFAPTPFILPTATAYPLPTQTAYAFPTSTDTPIPTPAYFTPTVTPVPPNVSSPTPTDTLTAIPSATPIPTFTDTPVPAFTATPTPQPTDTTTPGPTATATPAPDCPGSQNGCIQAMYQMINQDRFQNGRGGLQLDMTQSTGTGSCVGSYGHSVAMEESGFIWHQNPNYPQASFWNNICSGFSTAGENVGQEGTGNELQDLQLINTLMMSEPYQPGCNDNHKCNLLSTAFHSVGIGIYNINGKTWLTEDFTG